MKRLKIDVLGTEYEIIFTTSKEEPMLEDKDGCCDFTSKTIYIENDFQIDNDTVKDLEYYKKQVLRHELAHAFLFESGLYTQCSWAISEEAVDWIAIQGLKLYESWKETGAI